MRYLDGLNERQREAVLHTKGPLLIVAGAGAGKTRVITHRILHLVKSGVAPESILAITFTNKAAKEMRDRVQKLLSVDQTANRDVVSSFTNRSTPATEQSSLRGAARNAQRSPWIGTFHALGASLIRENARRLGIPRHFKIYDKSDSLSAVKEALKETDIDPKQFDPAGILRVISREKGKMTTLPKFRELQRGEFFPGVVAEVWERYQKILRRENALDFDDLLLTPALLLQNERLLRERYQKRWQYLHIDEYQDTNHVQYAFARLLSDGHGNIAVVGDGDQLIYGWRGASMRNILNFEKDYAQTKVVLLEENYRSTQTILAAANQIIKKNRLRREKMLFTKGGVGERLGLFSAYDEADEAAFIALKSRELISSGVSPSEIAVLFRANFQSRALEEAFLNAAVPYQVLGLRFFERKEVKDMLSYVRAAQNPASRSDMRRIINLPPRGLGKVALLKIFAGKEKELPAAAQGKIAAFRKLLAELKKRLETERLSAALTWVVAENGLEKTLKDGDAEDLERLENIKELVAFAARYDLEPDREAAVSQFLADAALQSDQDELQEERDAVRLMTVHASKGLEFEYVFIAWLEEGLFPHARTTLPEAEWNGLARANLSGDSFGRVRADETLGEDASEEERRLFYVALTRAKKKVYLSYAGVRTVFSARAVNLPSEFIFDIPEEFLEPLTIDS